MDATIPDELAADLAAITEQTGQRPEELIAEMLTEAIEMRRVPGILFADGATGRRARVGGTGIEVFEVIYAYEAFGHDRDRVKEDLPQLAGFQVDAAINSFEADPDDIRPWLRSDEEARADLEELWARIPETSPHWEGRIRAADEQRRAS